MTTNGEIVEKRAYPSPNPTIRLTEITYMSQGLRVKGLLAEPKASGTYDGFLYLRGGMQNIGMVRPARVAQFAAQGFIVFAPYYRGNRGGEGRDEFAGRDRFDAIYGVDVLKQFCNDNIHVFGFSRGGIMHFGRPFYERILLLWSHGQVFPMQLQHIGSVQICDE